MNSNNLTRRVIEGLISLGFPGIKAEDILIMLTNPFDAHAHIRRDKISHFIGHHIRSQFTSAFFMPNVKIPEMGDGDIGIRSYEKLLWYVNHIKPTLNGLQPLFSYYLSPDLSVEDIRMAWGQKLISGIKYYPKGGTTGSEKGLNGFEAVSSQLEVMSKLGIPLNIHGEIPSLDGIIPVKGANREALFYETEALKLIEQYPNLNVVCEHITTKQAIEFVKRYKNVFATITPHHLLLNDMALYHKVKAENDWYGLAVQLGFFPSMLCMPVLKDQEHVNALWDALVWQYKTQSSKFFLGTDTAYHPKESKYDEGCACGVFNSPVALEMVYMVFNYLNTKNPGIMDDMQRFVSGIGSTFYNIEAQPKKVIVIVKMDNAIPKQYKDVVAPFAGEILPWKAIDVTNFV